MFQALTQTTPASDQRHPLLSLSYADFQQGLSMLAASSATPTNWLLLPEDMVLLFLPWLTVGDLGRLSLVCRGWCLAPLRALHVTFLGRQLRPWWIHTPPAYGLLLGEDSGWLPDLAALGRTLGGGGRQSWSAQGVCLSCLRRPREGEPPCRRCPITAVLVCRPCQSVQVDINAPKSMQSLAKFAECHPHAPVTWSFLYTHFLSHCLSRQTLKQVYEVCGPKHPTANKMLARDACAIILLLARGAGLSVQELDTTTAATRRRVMLAIRASLQTLQQSRPAACFIRYGLHRVPPIYPQSLEKAAVLKVASEQGLVTSRDPQTPSVTTWRQQAATVASRSLRILGRHEVGVVVKHDDLVAVAGWLVLHGGFTSIKSATLDGRMNPVTGLFPNRVSVFNPSHLTYYQHPGAVSLSAPPPEVVAVLDGYRHGWRV